MAPCTRLDPVANPATMNTTTMATAWASASSPMPSTLPISSCTGRTDDSSTSTTRLDFSSPMPSAICDPYTLIRMKPMITVNSPVSRDDSDVEGACRPLTGSDTPCATAAAAPGTASISLDSPASCARVPTVPDTPPSGTCLTKISELGTRTALRSPLRSAALAAARLGSATTTAWPPDSRPASVTMPLIGGGDDADDADPVRLALSRTGWRAARRRGRPRSP